MTSNAQHASQEGFKYVKRQLAQGAWRQATSNGFPVYLAKRSGAFVEDFKSKGDNFCPHFKVLGVASGSCWTNCHGCFLKGTFRKMRIPGEPVLYENLDECATELDRHLSKTRDSVFSDGERCDSLLYDGTDFPVTQSLLPVFIRHRESGNRWLRLTKSDRVAHLLGLRHEGVMILSYSLNPQPVSDLFEARPAATMPERIRAARSGQKAGYPTRIRIDPIIPVEGWREEYRGFLHQMKKAGLVPDVTTLGTYRIIERSLPSFRLLGDPPPLDLADLIPTGVRREQRRLRHPDQTREEIYSYLIEQVSEIFPSSRIGLCKETRQLRSLLGFTDQDTICNCTLS